MALIGKLKNEWDTYDRHVEENKVMKNLEEPRFKFLGTSRSRAMSADRTLYLFESMQEDSIRFNIVMEDKEMATLKGTSDFKVLLREKCIRTYEEELNRLEEIARKKQFVLTMGDII